MKKLSFIIFLAIALFVVNSIIFDTAKANEPQATASNRTMQAKVKSKRVVEGTRLYLNLVEPVSTLNGVAGDSFDSFLVKDLKIDDSVILPMGTILRGTISKIKPSARLSRGAILYVDFDHIVTTEGRQLPVKAALCTIDNLTTDGGIIAGGNYGYALKQNWKKSGEIIKKSTDWGINSVGDIGNGYLKYATTPIAAFGGTLGGGAYLIGDSVADLFKKGGNVHLDKNAGFSVMLLKDLDIPVNY